MQRTAFYDFMQPQDPKKNSRKAQESKSIKKKKIKIKKSRNKEIKKTTTTSSWRRAAMADEFNTSTNWWDSSRNRFDSGSSSSSSGLNNSFGWPSEMVDVKLGRSCLESSSVSDTSSIVFHDNTHKLQQQQHPPQDSSSTDLHMMGLGLSSQSMDWTQAALLRGDSKTDQSSFRSMLQENLNFRSFSLDQPPTFSPHHHHGGSSSDNSVACQGGLQSSSYQMDSSVIYGSPSSMLQGLLGSDNNQYGAANYGNISNNNELVPSSWSNKVLPNFLRNSPPKQTTHSNNNNSQLHFSNNAPFWNASATSINDVRPTFFSSMQPQFPASNFEEKPPKNISEAVRDSSSTIVKKSGSETATKRPRNETPSPVPAFKVRKEKMGDRITALQQLVAPFGKTDTASVLSEAIEYIKFLHEQISVLSTPYMKSTGAPIHHQQNSDKSSNKDPEGQKQDLRSRGLCLVPVSSTFPVTHETTVDFWTPTFGGTYR